MILLLDLDNGLYHYCLKDGGRTVEEGAEHSVDLLKMKLCLFDQDHDIGMAGYRILDGNPCSSPARDRLMRDLMDYFAQHMAGCRHVALSDSAFYLALPVSSRAYAIPAKYTDTGLLKYGLNGLVHDGALKRLQALKGKVPGKVVSIFLNDSTDVVAVRDGKAVMSSHGFSGLDGIMSRTGCGAIDTSIVFQLFAAGYSAEGINDTLSRESGFKALLGEDVGLHGLMRRQDPQALQAREIFSYQLLKMIGSAAAVLDGIDAVVFTGEDQTDIKAWAYDFLRELEFLGLKRIGSGNMKEGVFTHGDSAVASYYFTYEKWPLMAGALAEQASMSGRVS